MRKLFLLLSVAIVLLGSYLVNNFLLSSYYLEKTVFFDDNTDFEHRVSVMPLDSGFAVAGKKELKYYDHLGELKWSKKIYLSDYLVDHTDKLIGICEKNTGEIVILDQHGKIRVDEKNIGTVLSFKIYPSDVFVVHTDSGSMFVYDKKLYLITLPQGDVLNYEYSQENRQLLITMLDNRLGTTLLVSTLTGQISSGNNLEGAITYNLQPQKSFFNVLTDDAKIKFSYDGLKLSEDKFDGLLLGFDKNMSIYKGEKGTFCIIDGVKESLKIELPPDYLGVKSDNEKLSIFGSKKVEIRGNNTKIIQTIDTKDEIVDVHLIENGGFLIEYYNKLEVFRSR